MAPLSNFLVPITSHPEAAFPVAERFLYAPSIGFCLVLGWLLMQALAPALSGAAAGGRDRGDSARAGAPRLRGAALRRVIPATLLGLALLAGAWLSALRARDWKNEVTLFAATVQGSPGNAMAQLNYGAALMELARGQPSIAERRALLHRAQRHLEEAVALAPGNYRGHYDLGNLHDSLGRPEVAERSFREALRLRPDLFQAMVNLGAILARTGRPAEALEWLEKADSLRPGNVAVMVNRAHVLQMLGHPEQAIPLYRQALAVDPGLVAARAGLDRALEALAHPDREGS